MPSRQSPFDEQTNALFEKRYLRECHRVNGFMMWLMLGQWIVGIGFAVFYSPFTWIGQSYAVHVHVWAAIVLGGAISGIAILWTRLHADSVHSRHVIAVSQMLWSALLIHLTGGRIETHFHVFASLAILSLYRDWKILITATVVVAGDHFIRGVFYPLSAFGVAVESPYRWIEHAAWVLFEISFLAPGCVMLRNEIRELCQRQTELEDAKRSVDFKIEERTHQLRQTNDELESSIAEAEKLALVARYTDNAVIITDIQSRIEWVNEGFTRITGYVDTEAAGERLVDLLHGPNTARKTTRAIEAAIQAVEPYDCEVLRYRKNGEPFWASVEARPIQDADGNDRRFIIVQRDISEHVAAELQRQRLNEQLVDASRTAGIAEIATGVLHNVGNVLNSINISASVIEKQIRRSAFQKLERITALIEENADDFGEFVRTDSRGEKIPDFIAEITKTLKNERQSITSEFADLLSNIEHIKEIVAIQQNMATSTGLQQLLAISEVIDDAVVANKGTLFNHHVKLLIRASNKLPRIVSDRHKILQILINLISNAKDAVTELRESNRRIDISATVVNDSMRVEVKDNGLGIASEQLSKIFQHGFTTKEEGHGFGLHSSANAATELGGSLVALSDGVGHGATFRLTIPIAAQAELSHNPAFEEIVL